MSDTPHADADADADADAVVAISDFLDGLGTEAARAEIAAKIASDPTWQRVHAEMTETREATAALSGLLKARAPDSFAQGVTDTIHKRSAGRFFARRTFGDRVPFGALAIAAVLGVCVVGYLMWASQTGSLARPAEHAPIEHGSVLLQP